MMLREYQEEKMNENWDLSIFYKGFDDEALAADMAAAQRMMGELRALAVAPTADHAAKIREIIAGLEAFENVSERLGLFVELTLSCDAQNEAANAMLGKLMQMMMESEQTENALCRYMATVENLDELIEANEGLKKNGFALREMAEKARHMIPEQLEGPVLRMQLSGGVAFSQLRDKLDATLTADYRGEQIPLSAVRGLAHDPDAAVRRDAYEAELACYKKVELPMSFCLNNIKTEAQTLAELRGYPDILSMTLAQSRMKPETLEAMWTAIREGLPELRENYFRAKGRLFGHENGIAFYDLFAPVGESARTYTIEEARALLVELFTKFCPEMGAMMDEAFENGWIDLYPHAGKSGGAFCASDYELNVSRIMTNFTGSASDVSTLAHELGHAFNSRMLTRMPRLMIETPMPLAETASTFNETVLMAQLLKTATPEEEIFLLDNSLTAISQTTADIYSRFLFESKVCAAQADHALSVRELCEAMAWAQEESYGCGLDPEIRHPYMWACKSHYYGTDIHFYNFPYAFGSLFARGLYALYEQQGEAFVPVYCDLLSRFGSDTIENVVASVGIDVTTPDFWRGAMGGVLAEAKRFAELAENKMKK